MMRRFAALSSTVVSVLVLGACGGTPAPTPPGEGNPPPERTPSAQAGELWNQFPASARPRPLVLTAKPPLVAGTSDTDNPTTPLAVTLDAALPSNPPTQRVKLPDGPADLPLIPAATALAQLRAATQVSTGASPAATPSTDSSPPPVRITSVTLGTAKFPTDRGDVDLPAWHFHPDGGAGPFTWPAIAEPTYWPLNRYQVATLGSVTAVNGSSLQLRLPEGRPSFACPGDQRYGYEPAVLELPTVVVVGLKVAWRTPEPGPRNNNCIYPPATRLIQYNVTLTTPLGGRVLVDHQGNVLPFKPSVAR
jgi:hypothetical protein